MKTKKLLAKLHCCTSFLFFWGKTIFATCCSWIIFCLFVLVSSTFCFELNSDDELENRRAQRRGKIPGNRDKSAMSKQVENSSFGFPMLVQEVRFTIWWKCSKVYHGASALTQPKVRRYMCEYCCLRKFHF